MTEIKGTEIEVRRPDAVIPDARNIRIMAADLFNSRMFRGIENVPQAVAVMQFGAEIGIGPVQALLNIKPIKGQMTMSARLIMGLAASKGVSWQVKESTDKRCEIVFSRTGWGTITSAFTIDEAKQAGLVKSDSGWDKYPQDMLFARAGSRGIRRIAPDAVFGMYSTEEMQDAVVLGPEAGPGQAPEAQEMAQKGGQDEFSTPSEGSGGGGAGLFPGDGEIDDISAMAESAEDVEAMEGKDQAFETAVALIKSRIEAEGVDLKSFKEWLFRYQNGLRPVKFYVGKIGSALRFHLGKRDEVLRLSQGEVLSRAIAKFRTGK